MDKGGGGPEPQKFWERHISIAPKQATEGEHRDGMNGWAARVCGYSLLKNYRERPLLNEPLYGRTQLAGGPADSASKDTKYLGHFAQWSVHNFTFVFNPSFFRILPFSCDFGAGRLSTFA